METVRESSVTKIRGLTTKEEWRHCPGSLNPDDVPSSGMNSHEMVNCSTWWDGPKYLQLSESKWPNDQSTTETSYHAMLEIVKNPPEVTHVLAASEEKPALVNLTKLSSVKNLAPATLCYA